MRPLTDETPAYYRKHAESNFCTKLIDRWATISFSVLTKDRQAKNSRIPYLTFGEFGFPGSRQIPNPVDIFCVFPNPAPFGGQIPDPVNTLLDEAGRCTRKTSSLTRLHDVLRKTLLQEARQNARSNEFILSSERAEFKAQSFCGLYRHLTENGADCAIYRHDGRGGGGEGEKKISVSQTSTNDPCNLCTCWCEIQWKTLKKKKEMNEWKS